MIEERVNRPVSFSTIVPALKGNLARYRHGLIHPSGESPEMIEGRAMHCRILEPHLFAGRFMEGPYEGKRQGKEKTAWKEMAAENPDVALLRPSELARVQWRAKAAIEHPVMHQWLRSPLREYEIQWTDPATKLKMKAVLDLVFTESAPCIIDIKSCPDASEGGWNRRYSDKDYHVQAAIYRRAVAHDTELRKVRDQPWPVVFFAIEHPGKEPFPEPAHVFARPFTPSAQSLQQGETELSEALEAIAFAREMKEWSGYSPQIATCELQRWRQMRYDNGD